MRASTISKIHTGPKFKSISNDLDFLSLCREDQQSTNKNSGARIVQNKLKDYKEGGVQKVFTDIVQKFDTKL